MERTNKSKSDDKIGKAELKHGKGFVGKKFDHNLIHYYTIGPRQVHILLYPAIFLSSKDRTNSNTFAMHFILLGS